MAPHVQDVAKALGGDHAHFSPVALDHDVGGNGGAMEQSVDLAWSNSGNGAKLHNALHHTDRLICNGAGHFVGEHSLPTLPARNLQHEVCKGSANINTDPDHRCLPDPARQTYQTWRPINATAQGSFCLLA